MNLGMMQCLNRVFCLSNVVSREVYGEIVDYATSVKKCGMAERVPIFRNEAKPSAEDGLFCTRYVRYFLQQVRKKNAKLC